MRILILCVLVLVARPAWSALHVPADSIRVDAATLPEARTGPHEEPLPGNQISGVVRAIHQDQRGDMWFGTQDGLLHHDGTTLCQYEILNVHGRPTTIRDIAESEDGLVWFGSSAGLTRYDGAIFTTFHTADGLVSDDVWRVFIDSAGMIWVCTIEGVMKFDGKRFEPFELSPSPRKNPYRGVSSRRIVWSIMEDQGGNLWFAAEGVVYRHNGDAIERIPVMDEETPTYVNCILEDREGRVWFATDNKGILRMDGAGIVNLTDRYNLGGPEAGNLHQTSDGSIWFPTEHAGMYRYHSGEFTLYTSIDGLGTHAVHRSCEDRAGRIWCGGWAGVYRFDGEAFVNVTRDGPW